MFEDLIIFKSIIMKKLILKMGDALQKEELTQIHGGRRPVTGLCPPLPPEEICCTLTNAFGCCIQWYIKPSPGTCEG